MTDTTAQEDRLLNVQQRLQDYSTGARDVRVPVASIKMRDAIVDRIKLPPSGRRLKGHNPWGETLTDFSDTQATGNRVKRKMEDETDLLNSYFGLYGVLTPEYDCLEPYTVLDTESYMVRATKRKHNLMFRNGFTFTSQDRPNLADYVTTRSNQIAYVMKRSFQNFMKEILWNLLMCSNVFLVKIRDHEASGGKASERNKHKAPVAGYELIPTHTIFPFMDGYGHIQCYRRFFGDGRPWRDYAPEDIVHFFWDRKPGHIYGTPRLTTVKDDIFALRRIEENAELLLVSFMFPFTHVKIGTEEAPCQYLPNGTSEVDMYRNYISEMPKEGVLVTDERVSVEIKGGEGKGVDSTPLRDHYKARIYVGFGVSPVDMGEVDQATQNSADNASQNLKDDVKSDLSWFCEQFKYLVLAEWFEEAPFKISVQNAVAEVNLEFHELDPDAQIKSEEHHLNMFNNHAINQNELRHRIKSRPFTEEEDQNSHFEKHIMSLEKHRSNSQLKLLRAKAQIDMAQTQVQAKADEKLIKANVKLTQAQAKLEQHKAKTQAVKNDAPAPAGGKKTTAKKSAGRPTSTGRSSRSNPVKAASPKKAVGENVAKPRNQHGTNLDPHKAKSSDDFFPMIHDELVAGLRGMASTDRWEDISRGVLSVIPELTDEKREEIWTYVSRATDEDLLFVYLKSCMN